MAISVWKRCSEEVLEKCLIPFEQQILLIEYLSLFTLIWLIIYIILIKFVYKKKIIKSRKIKLFSLSLFFLFLSFLYTFLNFIPSNILPRNCIEQTYEVCEDPVIFGKPIIYLYPEQKQEIKVELEVEWKLIADYPRYDEEIKGWQVTAYPDSTIIEDEKEYSYLFWEAEFENNDWDLSKWFIVEWKDAREFLQEKLSYIWLTPKEYNEFIVYWYPKMMNNKYNLVYFAWLDYTSKAPLNITPEPDSVLRVFTVIKPLKEKIDIQEQVLEKFDRKWFSVVEWWGTILE